MAIKRYYATKDNTITNAYKANLTARGISGNMGQSDISEVFSIYAQATTSSSELARILTQFDTTEISTDRTAGNIPASGSVSFFLRMYDARHAQTTPKDSTLIISAVSMLPNELSRSWQEGLGLDMENYSDEDASNWLYSSDDAQQAAVIIKIDDYDMVDETLILTGSDNEYLFTAKAAAGVNEWAIGSDNDTCAANLKTIINTSASADFIATLSTLGSNYVGVYAIAGGTGGNSNALTSSDTDKLSFDEVSAANTLLLGGNDSFTSWTAEGGDYFTDASSSFSQTFDTGFENLEVDVTTLVEQWVNSAGNVLGSKTNNGFGIHLTTALEDSTQSYYTKKFFARGSQYYFKRPIIEARWNSSKKDDRGKFFLSSSLVPASDNLMKLYLYNVVRGQLTNIPAVGTNDILVSIYSGSSAPTGSKLYLAAGGGVSSVGDVNITGSYIETGIYSCSFAYVSSSITNIFDVWHSGTIEYHTGSSINVKTFDSEDYNFDQNYISKITNLRTNYPTNETARFRLFARNKNWSPTIYTVANTAIKTSIVDNVYYKITRANDGLTVVDYGTGSSKQTLLSYDISGSYFDFNMNMLEANYAYEINFVYLINGSYVEQPETFRFNVV